MAAAPLPEPKDLRARPAILVAELGQHIGTRQAAGLCAELLEGADPHLYAEQLPYLAGVPATGVLTGRWPIHWARVWGARGLRYVWVDDVAPAVVRGLGDEHWRVAEMCVKVSGLRELGAAGDGVAALAHHELPRVREAVMRTLGKVGDTEHVQVVRDAHDDDDLAVRRAAARALRAMVIRLDLVQEPFDG